MVEAMIGPSSILLALMASGMNGQSFCFHGYLSRDSGKRKKELAKMEQAANNQTQLFMETPYRNEALLEDCLKVLQASTSLCIALDLSLPTEEVRRMSVSAWKKQRVKIHKRPAIFIIGH
jgi:16S rRNA (cytidine1402-2'-O)-methyltransferase